MKICFKKTRDTVDHFQVSLKMMTKDFKKKLNISLLKYDFQMNIPSEL